MKKKTISSLIKLNQFILVAALCFTGTAYSLQKREEALQELKNIAEDNFDQVWNSVLALDLEKAYKSFPSHIKELFNEETGYDLHFASDYEILLQARKKYQEFEEDYKIGGFTRYNPKEIYVGTYKINYNYDYLYDLSSEEEFKNCVLDVSSDIGFTETDNFEATFEKIKIRNTYYHEVGHVIFYEFVRYDCMMFNNFYWIYGDELEDFKSSEYHLTINCNSDHNVENISEYFASCFACYMLHPEGLQESAPRTYEMIDQIYNNSLESGKVLTYENK